MRHLSYPTMTFMFGCRVTESDLKCCLGSSGFLGDQGFRPRVGDSIEVTGTHVGNGSFLVANSLQMGGKTLTLRRASTTQGCPDCGGHNCSHYDCGYHHGCNNDHHGQCCDHE